MKTCRDFNVELCGICRGSWQDVGCVCWIQYYKKAMKHSTFNDIFLIYKNRTDRAGDLYFNKAIELFYPKIKEKIDKLMVLI